MVDAAADEELTIDVPAPLPDPTGNTRGTLTENVAATARQGSRRYQWTGPFTVPNPGFAGLGSGSEDVEMPTASPGGEGSQAGDGQDEDSGVQYVMSNAPALPAAPKYSGSTLQEKREFMRVYQTYVHALSAFHTATTKPYIMPVSACIEERTCNLICMYELNKDPSWVSEAEWVAYFLEALKPEQEDYTAIDEAMKNLKLKTTFPDAKSRMGQLRADMHKILDQHNVENIFFQKEQKKLVQYLVAALEPEDFREAIRKRLALDQHKDMRKDVVSCYKWILELLMAYLQWNPSSSKPNRAPARPQNGPATTVASGTNRRQTPFSRPPQAATPWRKSDKGIPPAEPAQKGPRPPLECLKCKSSEHRVRQCPQVRPEEIDALINAWKASRSASKTHMRRVQTMTSRLAMDVPAETVDKTGTRGEDDGTAVAHISGVPVPASLLDSCADDSLVSAGVVNKLAELRNFVAVKQCSTTPLYPVGGGTLEVSRKVRFEEVTLETPAGPLMLRGLVCWIDESAQSHALTTSRLVMKRLGYSTPKLLADAKARSDEYHLDDMDLPDAADRKFTRMHAIMRDKTEGYFEADEVDELVTTPSLTAEIDQQSVQAVLAAKVQEAREAGLPSDCVETLQQLLARYCDVFRLAFGNDPPIKVPPLKIRLKEGARPVKAKARRYPPLHREYLEKHLQELLDRGLVYINHRSRWASAPRIVAKKQPGEYRMTVDTRAINVLTDPMLWPMTDLEADLASAEGSEDYFTLDWWRGYWQLPLDEESQELFTIITHRGMVTPTRVLMGSSDSVAFCQGVVEQIFGPLLAQEILAWLDDILGFAKTPAALMRVLEHVLTLCEQYGLKLHPSKCCFYTREALWCGKLISADGVRHSPQRVQGLVDLPPPRTAGDLQQFICAVNWMRSSIPNYSALMADLAALLEVAATKAKSRKKTHLHRVLLSGIGWDSQHDAALRGVKEALLRIVPLAHARADWEVTLYADASDEHWGSVVTQVPASDLALPLEKQRRQPLAFLSGSFTGASRRWAIIDKEAFAILATCKRLSYLLLRPRGFHVYTDHRNLQYIFNPAGGNGDVSKFQADRLQRWAMTLTMFKYVIEHVSGEQNVWGDLLSRWGAASKTEEGPAATRMRSLTVVERVSPLQDAGFQWPSHDEIVGEQERALRLLREDSDLLPPCHLDHDQGIYLDDDDKIWIPGGAVDLQQRLCVITHAGSMGHRGVAATTQALKHVFTWGTLAADVQTFIRSCLHCMVVGEKTVPRPYGPALHATKPNELIHFDFLSMPESTDGLKYVLVIKDDMSGYVELIECADPDAKTACRGLLDWFKRFGVVLQWVSDRGAHFKNELITLLKKKLGGSHHFTTAYCPWANGSVEVVNRMLLRCLRALLSEMKLAMSDWTSVLPIVQSALNQTPADRLGGVAPVTAFTALPATTPLTSILHPTIGTMEDVAAVVEKQRQHIADIRDSLTNMHRELSAEAAKKRQQARDRRASKPGVSMALFTEGDFVLTAHVLSRANKLAVQWKGPKRIVKALSDYVFEVQDLMAPFAISTHHASRLKFYADASRNVTEDLVAQAMHADGGHLVSKLVKCRMGPETHTWEIQVEWIGLDPLEASWEPATIIYEDVPELVKRFVLRANSDAAQAMWASLTKTPAARQKSKPQRRRKGRG